MKGSLFSIIQKEILHIFRDGQTLFMVITMPLIMLMLYGYAITLDMKGIDLVVVDQSGSPQSRELIRHLGSTDFFSLKDTVLDSILQMD